MTFGPTYIEDHPLLFEDQDEDYKKFSNIKDDISALWNKVDILYSPKNPVVIKKLKSTDDLPEGDVNFYYTDERVLNVLAGGGAPIAPAGVDPNQDVYSDPAGFLTTPGELYMCSPTYTLEDAIADIGANDATVTVNDTQTLTANLTIPANVTLKVTRSGLIDVDTFAFTTNGYLSAGPYEIFDISGGGSVTIGSGQYDLAEWWGAVGDGTTDDEAAINAAIQAASSTYLLAKTYAVGDIIALKSNHILYGCGMDSTKILELNDFTLTSSLSTVISGVTITDFKVKDLWVQGTCTQFTNDGTNRHCIRINDSERFSVYRCKVSDTEFGCRLVDDCYDGSIDSCFATDCFYSALSSYGHTGTENYRISIVNNKCVDNIDPVNKLGAAGIRFEETYNSVITSNICSQNLTGIRIENSCNNTISSNTCSENEKRGVGIYNRSKRNTISNNQFYDNNAGYDTTEGAIDTWVINAAGTGYSVNDILSLALPADPDAIAAKLKVTAVDGAGGVTEVSMDAAATTVNRGWKYTTGVKSTTVAPAGGTGCTINITEVANRITATTPTRDSNRAKGHSGIEVEYACHNNTITGNVCYNSTTGNGHQRYGIAINNRNFTSNTEASCYNVVEGNVCINNDVDQISDRGFYNRVFNNQLIIHEE